MTTIYTAEEVAKHNTEKDVWLVIHNGVYDVAKFLQEHPGGEEVLIKLGGMDGSQCWDDIGHSEEAHQLRDNYKIGELQSGQSLPIGSNVGVVKKGAKGGSIDDDDWGWEPIKRENPYTKYFIAIGVALYALIVYYLWF